MIAVAPLAVVVASLFAILLILAVSQAAKGFSMLVPNWHIPGLGNIRQAVANAGASAAGAIRDALSEYARPLASFVLAPVTAVRTIIGSVESAVTSTGEAVSRVVHHLVPATLATARWYADYVGAHVTAFVNTQVANLKWYADQVSAAAHAYAHALAAQVLAQAVHMFDQAIAYTRTQAANLKWYADQVSRAAHAYTQAVAAQVLAQAVHMFNSSVAFTRAQVATVTAALAASEARVVKLAHTLAAQAVAAAYAAVQAAAHAACLPLWPSVVSGIDALDKAAEGAFTDALAGVRALPRAVPTDLAGVLTGTLTVVAALEKLAADCTIPNCRNLSGVGRDLQELFALAEGGALLALIIAAANDPEGTAGVVTELVKGVAA